MGRRPRLIAIDGPAGVGKSTLGARLAAALGYLFFDTGVLYRALTLAALEAGVDVTSGPELAALAERIRIQVRPPADEGDGRAYTVLLDGRDVTWAIRSPEVNRHVSTVAAHPEVRRALLPVQREIGRAGRVVMVGRDIGTVVLPEAELKIFLRASLEERARRRLRDLEARGVEARLEEVMEELAARDRLDSGREVAPLRPAPDALILDTDRMTLEEELEAVWAEIRARNGGKEALQEMGPAQV